VGIGDDQAQSTLTDGGLLAGAFQVGEPSRPQVLLIALSLVGR
jgi:hypothetical protein